MKGENTTFKRVFLVFPHFERFRQKRLQKMRKKMLRAIEILLLIIFQNWRHFEKKNFY